jgi:hypothetical protein
MDVSSLLALHSSLFNKQATEQRRDFWPFWHLWLNPASVQHRKRVAVDSNHLYAYPLRIFMDVNGGSYQDHLTQSPWPCPCPSL